MESHLIKPKFLIPIILFFIVCLIGSAFELQATLLTAGYVPDETFRLKLVAVENETDALEFQIFYSSDSASAFVFPHSTFRYEPDMQIGLNAYKPLVVKCCRGSYLPVFIQDGGPASGALEDGYEGPFYISMWLQFPNVAQTNKTHVCYAVKKGAIGTIGVRIGKQGDYRLVAYDNVKFIGQ